MTKRSIEGIHSLIEWEKIYVFFSKASMPDAVLTVALLQKKNANVASSSNWFSICNWIFFERQLELLFDSRRAFNKKKGPNPINLELLFCSFLVNKKLPFFMASYTGHIGDPVSF